MQGAQGGGEAHLRGDAIQQLASPSGAADEVDLAPRGGVHKRRHDAPHAPEHQRRVQEVKAARDWGRGREHEMRAAPARPASAAGGMEHTLLRLALIEKAQQGAPLHARSAHLLSRSG